MLKTLRLLKEWEGIVAGTILQADEKTASELLDAKTAEAYDPEAEQRAKEAKDEERRVIVEAVKAAVKEEVKTAPEAKTAMVEVHERSDDDPKRGFKHLGDFCLAVRKMALGDRDERLIKAASGMNEGIDSDGGFTVPDEFRAQLLQHMWDYSVLASRATQLPMASNSVTVPYLEESSRADGSRQGGVLGYWTEEAGAPTASKAATGQLHMKLKKVMALLYATDELLEDSAISMEPLINRLAGNELAFQIDDKVMNGSGSGVPLGVLNSPCLISVAKESGQVADTIVWENIIKMWARMPTRSRANAVWYISQDTEPQLMTMAQVIGTGGVPVYLPASGAAGSPYGTLMGRPVIPTEFNPAVGDKGDIVLADMSQYLLGQKSSGIKSASSIHVKFTTEETAFRFSLRVDGQPWWKSAITPFSPSGTTTKTATISPFVTLAART